MDPMVGVLDDDKGPFPFSFSTAGVAGVAEFMKSNAVPGVFGVFAEPNPNAPDPRPKAFEADDLVLGDDIPPVARGVILLNGFVRLLWELVWPSKRFVGN